MVVEITVVETTIVERAVVEGLVVRTGSEPPKIQVLRIYFRNIRD